MGVTDVVLQSEEVEKRDSRAFFAMVQSACPQGLKPAFLLAGRGTAEAVPFPKSFLPKTIFETSSSGVW
jgi:hypothetical protein